MSLSGVIINDQFSRGKVKHINLLQREKKHRPGCFFVV